MGKLAAADPVLALVGSQLLRLQFSSSGLVPAELWVRDAASDIGHCPFVYLVAQNKIK